MTPPESAAHAFERHRMLVESVAAKILRDRDEARDVASETFLALLERGPADERAALPWLLATARNKALNRVRDRGRAAEKARRAATTLEREADAAAFGDDAAAELVRRALERLSQRDRDAIKLRFIQELGYDEIAARLGTTGGHARVVVHRAARRLRNETVAMLADHHKASPECSRRLLRTLRTHHGCTACAAVVDEVAAMSALGVLPLAFGAPAVLKRLAHAAGRVAGEVRVRVPHTGGRLGEAVAAAVLSGALAAPAAVPGVALRASAPDKLPGAGVVFQEPATAVAAGSVAEAAPARHRAARSIVTQQDENGDAGFVSHDDLRMLGVPVSFADALEGWSGPGYDIRSFQVGTIARPNGAPSALLFRLVMAGVVPDTATYEVRWRFEQDGCRGWAGMDRSGSGELRIEDGVLHVDCYGSPSGASYRESGEPQSADLRIETVVRGNVVEIVMPFAGLSGIASLIRPGARLLDLYAVSALAGTYQDRAPDGRAGIQYTIEE
jgi:RNA polymerase sigma-70 factor (ECF subfamily)